LTILSNTISIAFQKTFCGRGRRATATDLYLNTSAVIARLIIAM